MYSMIRLLIIFFLLFTFICLFRKRKNKLIKWTVGVAFTVVSVFLCWYPVENCFYSFRSPEALFQYRYSGSADLKKVIPGQNCDWLVERSAGNWSIHAAIKCDDGWKIERNAVKQCCSALADENDVFVSVYSYQNAADSLVVIVNLCNRPLTLSDEYGSVFVGVSNGVKEEIDLFCANISSSTTNYVINIDGEDILLNY